MDNETTRDFLDRRRRELEQQLSALHGQMTALRDQIEHRKREIEEIDRAAAAIGPTTKVVSSSGMTFEAAADVAAPTAERNRRNMAEITSGVTDVIVRLDPYSHMTIKELVIQALIDHFPKGGTLTEIRDVIRNAYRRTIEPPSLRPQMHRLKADGILGQDHSTDTWNFRDGKRGLYAMYNHPTSRKAMKELQDDKNLEGEPRTRLRDIE
jgi:hypothetical protein